MSLRTRVEELELAVLALATQEFGDVEGHPFRGNQYTTSQGGNGDERDEASQDEKDARQLYADLTKGGYTHSEAIDEIYNEHGDRLGEKLDREMNALSEAPMAPSVLDKIHERVVNDYVGNRIGSKAEAEAYADKVVKHAEENRISNWEDARNSFNDAPHVAAQQEAFERVRANLEDRAPKRGDIAVLKDGSFVQVDSAAKGYISGDGTNGKGNGLVYHEGTRHDQVVGVISAKDQKSGDAKNVAAWIKHGESWSVGDVDWKGGGK